MLRATVIDESPTGATLRVEGGIVSHWTAVLEQECEAILTRTAGLRLDLTDVAYADAGGIAMLRRLGGRITITSCSPLVRELLKVEECA